MLLTKVGERVAEDTFIEIISSNDDLFALENKCKVFTTIESSWLVSRKFLYHYILAIVYKCSQYLLLILQEMITL